jgi:hypothetical protein
MKALRSRLTATTINDHRNEDGPLPRSGMEIRMLRKRFGDFCHDEGGAVTVDWVVLTGGVIIFGVMVAASIISGSTSVSQSAGNSLANAKVPTIDFNRVD